MSANYSNKNSLVYPSGTTAARPTSVNNGFLYFNTTIGALQIYQNGSWYVLTNITAPGAPTSVTATNQGSGRAFNNGQASVAFTPASDIFGFPATFTVTGTPIVGGAGISNTGSSSPITITGLQSNMQYEYVVTAANNTGTSSTSTTSSSVLATTVPEAPTIGSVTAGNEQVSVSFTSNSTGGSAITSYTVTSSPGGFTSSGASSPITVTGLTNGTSYTFTVTASNANGTSLSSSASSSVTPNAFSTTGGTQYVSGGYTYHKFTSNGTLTVSGGSRTAEVLVIAGGGGVNDQSGGGGAGGLVYHSSYSISAGNYTVAIGGGGAANTNGTDTQFNNIYADGGGRCVGRYDNTGRSGGSGGAGTFNGFNGSSGGSATQPSSTRMAGGTGYGNAGGSSAVYGGGPWVEAYGGGGGAGAAGQNGIDGGKGGNGLSTWSAWGLATSSGQDISGVRWFAGGGGQGNNNCPAGAGGNGGGGSGGSGGNPGMANTGGGAGGGGGGSDQSRFQGGSGIVIIRYQ